MESSCHEFKGYTWPIKNNNIINHISKTITGFMNSKGGIMYIGIMEGKDKRNSVLGITINQSEVKDIKDSFVKYVGSVNPRHKGFEAKGWGTNCVNECIINNYVKLEFIPVINPLILTNIQERN